MNNLTTLFYKVIDLFAMIGLAFNVDWDKEYEDDDYVKVIREELGR